MSAGLVTHLLDLLEGTAWAGRVRARRMFGGHGLYCDERMCGLIANDVLYLKTDDGNRARFVERELEPFIYVKRGTPMALSYWQAPAEALEDGTELAEWLESARQAAVRAAARKSRGRKKVKR